jgi:outer membrane murein-binding lipoprotein Lpp
MSKTRQTLNDEPMQMLEWCGTLTCIEQAAPAKSKRVHAWHASCSVLAALTSVLILNGCDSNDPVDQAAQEMKQEAGPLSDNAAVAPEPTQEPVGAQDDANEPASEAAGPPGDDMQKQ